VSSQEFSPASPNEKRKIRKLNLRIRHLIEDLEEAEHTSDEYEVDFRAVISVLRVELGISPLKEDPGPKQKSSDVSTHIEDEPKCSRDPQPEPEQEPTPAPGEDEEFRREIEDLSKTAPAWMKRVYKQIAMETHPDRIRFRDDLSLYEKANRKKCFEDARAAMQIQDGSTLLSIAETLHIDAEIDATMRITMLESKAQRLKVQFGKLIRTPAWVWGESWGRNDIRKKLLQGYCKIYKWNIPNEKLFFDEFLKGLDESAQETSDDNG